MQYFMVPVLRAYSWQLIDLLWKYGNESILIEPSCKQCNNYLFVISNCIPIISHSPINNKSITLNYQTYLPEDGSTPHPIRELPEKDLSVKVEDEMLYIIKETGEKVVAKLKQM